MDEPIVWRPLLRDALAALAASPDVQIRTHGPGGCVSCDLLEDFDHARLVTLANVELSDEQRRSLHRIEAEIRAMSPLDQDCSNIEVIRKPAWQSLRDLAQEALRMFHWEHAEVRPFIEIQPGLWHRVPSED